MFNLFRSREKSVRVMLGVLLGLVAISMLWYLIPGGMGGAGGGSDQNTLAQVGDEKITTRDVQRRFDLLTRNQPNVPRALLAIYVPNVINQLVTEKAVAYKASELGLTVSDTELGGLIRAELAQASGGREVDMATYEALLAQQGLTVPAYETLRREQVKSQRLQAAASQAMVVTTQQAQAEYRRTNDKIALAYVALDEKSFEKKVKPDHAALLAYFNKNRSLFRIPQKRSVQLFVGSTAEFLPYAKVSDTEVQRRYQENLASYQTPERVNVRHILVKTQGKAAAEAAKLRGKADDLLKQLKEGADFAALAKQNSDDPGSAQKGGELGWIVRGQTVPAFERAAFSLKPGEFSDIITTEYGYHILQVKQHDVARLRPLDEVRPELMAEMEKQQAQTQLEQAMSEARLAVVKAPAQAEQIAKTHHLKFYKEDGLSRDASLPDVGNQPAIASAIFALPSGGVTEVSPVPASGKSAFARVLTITPERDAELAEVQPEVESKFRSAEASRLMEDAARSLAAEARKGVPLAKLAKQYGGTLKSAPPFTVAGAAEGIGAATLLSDAFTAQQGAITGPYIQGTNAFVCQVTQKLPADMTQFAKSKNGIEESLRTGASSLFGGAFEDSIVQDLTRRHKIKRNQAAISRVIASFKS